MTNAAPTNRADGPCERAPAWVLAVLALLTLLAAVERFAGLDAQLPHVREADAALVHYAAWHDRPAGVFRMSDAVYPSTVYPVFLGRVLARMPGSGYPVAAPGDAPLEAHLAAASAPYLRARRLVALLSLFAIPFTWAFARRWLGARWALLAAGLVATSMLGLEMGVVAKPHGALVGFVAVALWAMLRLLERGTRGAYLAAGLSTACALGTLNTGCFLVPSLALAHLLGVRADGDRARHRRFLALCVAPCALLFVSSYWFLFVSDPDVGEVAGAFRLGEQAIDWSAWNGGGFRDLVPRTFEHDPALVVLAALGLVASAVAAFARRGTERAAPCATGTAGSRRGAALVVLLYAAVFVVMFGLHARYFSRFSLALVPVLALAGAYGVRALARLVESRLGAPIRVVGPVLALAALAFPFAATLHLARLRARDDTAELAARWLRENPPASGPIAVDVALMLPVLVRPDALAELPEWARTPWPRYQLEVLAPDPRRDADDLRLLWSRGMLADRRVDRGEVLARLAKLRPRLAFVAVPAPGELAIEATRAAVRELAGEPIAAFTPLAPGGSLDSILTREADPDFLAHLFALERLGPPIEAYALP